MKNNETGRSMVEMLGVLAIIGVLSVAGIAGYSMAMKKIKINDIISAASQCAVLARTYQGGSTTINTSGCIGLGIEGVSGATLTASHIADNSTVTITITPANGSGLAPEDISSAIGGTVSGTDVVKEYNDEF